MSQLLKKTKPKQDPHKKSLPLGKWRFTGKRGPENGPKAKKDKTEKSDKTKQKNKRDRGDI